MTRSRLSTKRQPRHGFTLIELLVVISIIAVLVSLVAPAVQAARRTARKLQCLSNMRQIGLAMQAFSATNGSLPTLTYDIPVNPTNNGGNNTAGASGYIYGAGWPIALLPALDAAAVQRNIKNNAYDMSAGTVTTGASFGIAGTPNITAAVVTPVPNDNIWLEAFTCPDDTDSFRLPGGLSFVVNAGFIPNNIWGIGETIAINTAYSPASTSSVGMMQPYIIDWTGNGNYSLDGTLSAGTSIFDPYDQGIELATGVIFRATAGSASNSVTPSLDAVSVGDGQTTTLMITENLNAGPWNGSLAQGSYYNNNGTSAFSYGVNQLGIGLSIPVTAGVPSAPIGAIPVNAAGAPNIHPAYWNTLTSNVPDTNQYSSFINRNLSTAANGTPRPSSQHSGGVNAIMCDGSGRYLNENMDKFVYTKILTSNGVTYGEATLDSRGF